MNISFRQSLRKHNGFIALVLSMVIVISCSLQLVHGQLLDHDHTIDCPMFVLDGGAAVPEPLSQCISVKQVTEEHTYHPIALMLSLLKKQEARAPPASV